MYEGIYRFNSKRVRKKEKYANSKWILGNLFCCCSNLSNDDIISERPGLIIGMDFRGAPRLKTGMKNDIFWSEIGSGFGERGGTPPLLFLSLLWHPCLLSIYLLLRRS